jgi:hypothetical protein
LITTYLDDSGTDPANPVAATGGFIAPNFQWNKFTKEWRAAMAVPGDEFACMHISECVAGNQKSEFRDWSLEKKRRVLKRLRGIIKKRASKAISMAISKDFYDTLIPDEIKKKTGNNFTLTVMQTMAMVGRWRREQMLVEPIYYVFDWLEPNDERRRQLEELFENECERGSALHDFGLVSGGYTFQHKEDIPPLQAADMLAWLSYNLAQHALDIKKINQLGGECFIDFKEYQKRRKWLDAGYQTADQLKEFVDQLPSSPDFSAAKELRPPKKKKRR